MTQLVRKLLLLALAGALSACGIFGSDDDETFSPGSNLQKVAHVTFDQRTSQVVGWESIWAIIEGEEAEKDLLV